MREDYPRSGGGCAPYLVGVVRCVMGKKINVENTAAFVFSFGLDSINEELIHRGLAKVEDAKAGSNLLAMFVTSLDSLTVLSLNLSEGMITSEELGDLMGRVFPENRIGVRHGPHYLSLARHGNLSKAAGTPRHSPAPSAARRGRTAKGMDLSAVSSEQLEAMAKAAVGTPLHRLVQSEITKRSLTAPAVEPAPVVEEPKAEGKRARK